MSVPGAINEFLAKRQKNTENEARKKYPWQTTFENAMLETDPVKRAAKIAFAETIMYARQNSLAGYPNAVEERTALHTAIATMRKQNV